jgi:hypothetical protein
MTTATSHCFPLNGNDEAPEICGIANIMETYRAQQQHIELSSPTLFEHLLRKFHN